jgi:Major tropism determinant N-terminal domain
MNRIFPGVITMPLQIRRGTEAERTAMTLPLSAGELLFVTNTERLYVGNGSTLGGVPITGYTNEDAQDAVGAALVAGNATNGNIAFTYGSTADTANRINAAVNLSNYVGTIGATAVNANTVANDATVLVNVSTGAINLNGTVKGHVIPNANETYDLGSATYRFRDLYLSGSSIKLGSATITASGAAVDLPAGSTIAGAPIPGFGAGQNINANIVGDDSTILVNTSSNTLQGTHLGVQRGNVQASDTTVMIDATAKTIAADSITLGGYIGINGTTITNSNASNVIRFDGASIDVFTNFGVSQPGISATGVTNGAQTSSLMAFYGSRGTVTSPTTLNNNDPYSGLIFLGHNGSDHVEGAAMFAQVDGVPNSANPSIPGKFVITVANGTDSIFTNNKQMIFSSNGVLSVPIIKPASYATGSLPTSPQEGWIVFDSTTKEWKGWNGTLWQVLG